MPCGSPVGPLPTRSAPASISGRATATTQSPRRAKRNEAHPSQEPLPARAPAARPALGSQEKGLPVARERTAPTASSAHPSVEKENGRVLVTAPVSFSTGARHAPQKRPQRPPADLAVRPVAAFPPRPPRPSALSPPLSPSQALVNHRHLDSGPGWKNFRGGTLPVHRICARRAGHTRTARCSHCNFAEVHTRSSFTGACSDIFCLSPAVWCVVCCVSCLSPLIRARSQSDCVCARVLLVYIAATRV